MVAPIRHGPRQRWVTAEALFAMGDIGRCELVKGEIVHMSPGGGRHGNIGAWFVARLSRFAEKTRAGVVFGADTGFILARDPDVVRAPDAAFVRSHRIPQSGVPPEYFPGAPDLAIEVFSPEDTWPEARRKAAEYLDAGAHAVWLVHPTAELIEVHAPGRVRVFRARQWVSASAAAPGFRVRVVDVFATLNDLRRGRKKRK